jgi:hypothetical protein
LFSNFFSFKHEHQLRLPPLQQTRVLDIHEDNSNDLGIYAENDKDEDIDELDQYFEERRKGHQVSFLTLKIY